MPAGCFSFTCFASLDSRYLAVTIITEVWKLKVKTEASHLKLDIYESTDGVFIHHTCFHLLKRFIGWQGSASELFRRLLVGFEGPGDPGDRVFCMGLRFCYQDFDIYFEELWKLADPRKFPLPIEITDMELPNSFGEFMAIIPWYGKWALGQMAPLELVKAAWNKGCDESLRSVASLLGWDSPHPMTRQYFLACCRSNNMWNRARIRVVCKFLESLCGDPDHNTNEVIDKDNIFCRSAEFESNPDLEMLVCYEEDSEADDGDESEEEELDRGSRDSEFSVGEDGDESEEGEEDKGPKDFDRVNDVEIYEKWFSYDPLNKTSNVVDNLSENQVYSPCFVCGIPAIKLAKEMVVPVNSEKEINMNEVNAMAQHLETGHVLSKDGLSEPGVDSLHGTLISNGKEVPSTLKGRNFVLHNCCFRLFKEYAATNFSVQLTARELYDRLINWMEDMTDTEVAKFESDILPKKYLEIR